MHTPNESFINRNRPGFAHTGESAQARIVVLVLAAIIGGFAAGVFWYHRAGHLSTVTAEAPVGALSESTRAALQRLESPVEIRFYAVLDPSLSTGLQAFAGRVDRLLTAYEQAGRGQVTVLRHNSRTDAVTAAAAADGIRAFNLDQSDACFLGLALAGQSQKESIPQLSPEWEAALEADLTRALLRVAGKAVAEAPARLSPEDVTAAEVVQRTLPDLTTVSLEDGTRILREAALKEFKTAATEMQAQVEQAQQRFSEARQSGSEAGQQAALKQLQQVQAEQTEKLKAIAAQLQDQIAALQRLKKE